MNMHDKTAVAVTPELSKADAAAPCLKVTGRDTIVIKAGTSFNGVTFAEDTPVAAPTGGYLPGYDYVVSSVDGAAAAFVAVGAPVSASQIGGFHFAPGGNATARAGGDAVPAINPFSIWDQNYRPVCNDPRGMACIEGPRGKFWCDIYLLNTGHDINGTSRFGYAIADGKDLPVGPDGVKVERFDYPTAVAAMARHGKSLLAFDEFFAAMYGVTEKTARDGDPSITGCDPARTSKFGVMQATGNLWVWGHDGDPDEPRASLFGGGWGSSGHAGSRYASLGYWPVNSSVGLGARGRSDHLQLG